MLVSSYVVFTALGWIPVWVFVAVFSRDLLILLGWTVVYILTGNSKIQPRPLGKLTTALQMAVALAKLVHAPLGFYTPLLEFMIGATIVSAVDYVWVGNKRLGAMG